MSRLFPWQRKIYQIRIFAASVPLNSVNVEVTNTKIEPGQEVTVNIDFGTTLGAYQLLGVIPIERTQCALDPKAPIYESYIPDILKNDLFYPYFHNL